MSRRNTEAEVEFGCDASCAASSWTVEGRWNAEGEFEATDTDELDCPECGQPAAPLDDDVKAADL